jgi:hypothetical protein
MKDKGRDVDAGMDIWKLAKSFFANGYFKSGIVLWLIILSGVVNLADWVALKIFVQPVDFPIILHYNVYFGVDTIGDYRQVFILPVIGLVLFLVNLGLSLYFYNQKERIASYLLLMATLMIQLSLLIAVASVIIINY